MSKLLEVKDVKRDDSIYVCVENNEGIITGCNPRAVLIAAYRFLKELGVAWVRPTDDGEVVNEKKLTDINVKVQEKASYRHRAICIEGSVSYEHVLNMIKWIPRAGLSGYFFQFSRPFHFFDRWYSHTSNPNYEKENVITGCKYNGKIDVTVANTSSAAYESTTSVGGIIGQNFYTVSNCEVTGSIQLSSSFTTPSKITYRVLVGGLVGWNVSDWAEVDETISEDITESIIDERKFMSFIATDVECHVLTKEEYNDILKNN
jgi:hypothetical protein